LFCDTVAQQAFPTSCLGNASFNASYTNADDSAIKLAKYQSLPFSVRICAPRNTTSPWEVTGNRQDIMEEFYLDFQYPSLNQSAPTEMDPRTGFTHHCRATTTMGYFELPNDWNNQSAGPLLESYPDYDANSDSVTSDSVASPGPLVASILAIFGKGSFFHTIISARESAESYDALCLQLRQPFTGISRESGINWDQQQPSVDCQSHYVPGLLVEYLYTWLINFRKLDNVKYALDLAMFSSNKAMLNLNKDADVFMSPGMVIQVFHILPIAMIITSVLIALQLFGLIILALYASIHPSWTETLDSFAVLRLGAAMADELPSISPMKAKELGVLDVKEGWVGEFVKEQSRQLVIGGQGKVRGGRPYHLGLK